MRIVDLFEEDGHEFNRGEVRLAPIIAGNRYLHTYTHKIVGSALGKRGLATTLIGASENDFFGGGFATYDARALPGFLVERDTAG